MQPSGIGGRSAGAVSDADVGSGAADGEGSRAGSVGSVGSADRAAVPGTGAGAAADSVVADATPAGGVGVTEASSESETGFSTGSGMLVVDEVEVLEIVVVDADV